MAFDRRTAPFMRLLLTPGQMTGLSEQIARIFQNGLEMYAPETQVADDDEENDLVGSVDNVLQRT